MTVFESTISHRCSERMVGHHRLETWYEWEVLKIALGLSVGFEAGGITSRACVEFSIYTSETHTRIDTAVMAFRFEPSQGLHAFLDNL